MMKTSMMRIVCLILALMTLSGLFACQKKDKPTPDVTSGNGSTAPTDATEPTPAETDEWGQEVLDDEIPEDLKYNGEVINIVTRPRELWIREFGVEERQDNVDQQVYFRNVAVENKLDLQIKMSKWNELTGKDLAEKVYATWLANTKDVDLVVGSGYYMTNATVKSCFTDFNDHSKMPYLKSQQKYWNQNYINAATIYDHLYYIIGDMNLSVYDRTIVTYANLSKLEAMGHGDIMDVVLNKEWTMEKFQSILNEVSFEEFDGVEGATEGDKYALSTVYPSEALDSFFGGFRLQLMKRNEAGGFDLNITGNERLQDASTLVNEFYKQDNVLRQKKYGKTFVEGRSVFEIDVMFSGRDQNYLYRNMADRYVILPMPLYDGQQTDYGVIPQDAYNLMGVMSCSAVDQVMMSAFLEMMCSRSYETVRPYYIEQMIKGRYLKEAKNVQIMELILDSVYFDPGAIYSIQLENLQHNIWRLPCDKGTSVFTAYGEMKNKIDQALDEFDSWYMTN